MRYKVQFFQNNIYEVLENTYRRRFGYASPYNDSFHPPTTVKYKPEETWESVFQGTLPECEAWINLHEKGYM